MPGYVPIALRNREIREIGPGDPPFPGFGLETRKVVIASRVNPWDGMPELRPRIFLNRRPGMVFGKAGILRNRNGFLRTLRG